jgi:probable rRNA maturation factor
MAASESRRRKARQGPRVQVALRVAAPGAAHAARVLRAAAREQLARLRLAEVSLSLVTDREMRALNRKWRLKDAPTDVLSFPMAPVGDVVISLDTARRQAREGGWPLAAELRRLLAHGLLHCLGHDHQRPAAARRMARAEERLLGREGMVGSLLNKITP